jgi:hypothetical protein
VEEDELQPECMPLALLRAGISDVNIDDNTADEAVFGDQ